MPKATHTPATKKRRKKILKLSKGYRGSRRNLYRMANTTVMKALANAYKDRRRKKRVFRSLWIVRMNAALEARGLSYSKFIWGLKNANIDLDRKTLSELAAYDDAAFNAVVERVRAAKA